MRSVACPSVAFGTQTAPVSKVVPTLPWPSINCQPRFSQCDRSVQCQEFTHMTSKGSWSGSAMFATTEPAVNAATVPTRFWSPCGGHWHGQHSLPMSQLERDRCSLECCDAKWVASLSRPSSVVSSATDVQGVAPFSEAVALLSRESVPHSAEHRSAPQQLARDNGLIDFVDDFFKDVLDDEDHPCALEGSKSQSKIVDARSPEISAQARKKKLRPCKGQRQRFKRMMVQIREKVQQNPDAFNFKDLLLPPRIANDPSRWMNVYNRVQKIVDETCSQRNASLAESSSSVS